MSEEASRANWNFLYEKGLVEILTKHKVDSRFRGQNSWNSDGWKSVTNKFNEKFPLACFTKQQLQDKEKDLKASYKAINNAKKESGTSWNKSMGMITAEPDLWSKCASKYPKIKKHHKNGFPLFRSCEVLYEGSIVNGDLSFTELMEHNPSAENNEAEQFIQSVPCAFEARELNEGNDANLFSAAVDGHEVSEAQSPPAGTSTHGSGKKRKQSQIAAVLDDYLEYKKKLTEKTVDALLEKKNLAEEYSVKKCLDTVDAMVELMDEEKVVASEVFESDMNREMFMKQKNLNMRLIWLWRKIRITS